MVPDATVRRSPAPPDLPEGRLRSLLQPVPGVVGGGLEVDVAVRGHRRQEERALREGVVRICTDAPAW